MGILIQFVPYSFAFFSSHNKKIKYPVIGIKYCSDILESSDFGRSCLLYATWQICNSIATLSLYICDLKLVE